MPAPAPDTVGRLFAVVERLTRKHIESVPLPGGKGRHYGRHDALAKQLRDAIGGNVKGGGTGGKPASERTPIDPDALQKYMNLVSLARQFHEQWVGEVPDLEARPESMISAGYRAMKRQIERKVVPDSAIAEVVEVWEAECETIVSKLSPPTVRELDGFPCPNCGFSRFEVILNRSRGEANPRKRWRDSEERVALTMTFRPDTTGSGLRRSSVSCGCCHKVWRDQDVRYVAAELDRYESTAIALWAAATGRAEETVDVRKAAWRDLPLASRTDPPLVGREEWMQLGYQQVLTFDAEPEPTPGEPA
jgi:hypothetical protein